MTEPPEPTSLRDAVRRARLDDIERGDAVTALRGAETARLEVLYDALQPVLAQIPEGIDTFDHGLVQGERPRLYIDMLAFVDMGRDKRHYRMAQDGRWGRRILAETESVEDMVGVVTRYIAARLVEREKALASDTLSPPPAAPSPEPLLDPPVPSRAIHALHRLSILVVLAALAALGIAVVAVHPLQ